MSSADDRPWSPYVVGAGIGALEWFAFATAKKGLGVTAPFETGAVMLEQQVAPEASQVNRFLVAREEPPAIDWELALAAGVAIGSSLVTSGHDRGATVPPRWQRRFGPSTTKRLAAAFAGGALMMFGARTAKGCTSGHGITGTLQLAASSWLFSVLMGATAAIAARGLYGKGE